MNLDRHLIPIRTRTFPGLCDLAFQVVRSFLPTLLLALAITAVPLAIFNHVICQLPFWWTSDGLDNPGEGWVQLGLVFVESQIGTVLITAWLGRAMFYDRPTIAAAVGDVRKTVLRVGWVHLILRPFGLLVLMIWYLAEESSLQGEQELAILATVFLFLIIAAVRVFRPFASEIVILEKTPVLALGRQGKPAVIGFGRRSRNLHGFAGSVILGRTMLFGMVAGMLITGIYGMIMFSDGVLATDLGGMGWARQLFWTVSLWLVAGFAAVVRFLSYIDLRARQEGWDAELKIKAEAIRMAAQ